MNQRELTRLSKFLSLVLRHEPQAIGLTLDAGGWASVEELLRHCRANGKEISRAALDEVVATSPKRRFAVSEDGLRIRANQGHSVEIDLGYTPVAPPDMLFHGTAGSFLESIRAEGLRRMQRHHIHLSADVETATAVGRRHGAPVVLRVHARKMHEDGYTFYLSANGVCSKFKCRANCTRGAGSRRMGDLLSKYAV